MGPSPETVTTPSSRSLPPIRLVPLLPAEFDGFVASLLEAYAQDHVQGGQWTPERALEQARAQVTALLPRGVDTPDHYLRTILKEPEGVAVGRLWYAVRREEGPAHLFVYDIIIAESARGKGYGEAAMRALEPIAREMGLPRIALHVFGHNEPAIRLYERIGYKPTNLLMSKPVAP